MFRSQYADVPALELPVPGPLLAGPTGTEVMRYAAGRVAPYKRVRRVTFVDRVPRAASGTILRREPRERP